jgi:CheY-like chemotaxis protein
MANILLVEDDAMLAYAFGQGLQKNGYEVMFATSALDAIDALMRYDVGLMVLDMNLPDAPGTEVLDYVESEPSLMEVPIIVLTAYTRFTREGMRPSVYKALTKPLTPSALVQIVEEALAG